MNHRAVNILIGGEAGQGLQTIGLIFAKSLVRSGFRILAAQTYESRIRGGHNTFSIRVGTEKVLAPEEMIDLLVALNKETIELHKDEISPQGFIIGHAELNQNGEKWIGVPLKELGKETYWNTASIGVAACLLGLERQVVGQAIQEILGEERALENLKVLKASYDWLEAQSYKFERLPSISNPPLRLLMNGHESVAFGAVSAGLKFCAFYPMSPSTSIAQTLIDCAKEMDLIVVQAEDEIAAINLAVGASYAGAPSMVPTSGGGFALMVETVSLSAVSETPLVIVIGQRPGPATGLATRTEQGELWFVLHAGHGEFPRAIFAPGSVEECFHLTRKAFELAEKYQGPIFILTDHFLADCYADLDPIHVEELSFIKPGSDPNSMETPYLRYRITESGVSPRLLPGLSRHLVVADSHEHTENGHMTENLSIRPKMVDKRLRKGNGIRSEVIPPAFLGDDEPEILFVCWGSSKGSVEEAALKLSSKGIKTATLHFSQVWPMVPDQFLPRLERAKQVISVESNATGQLTQLIRRETGFVIKKRILRYDGLAMTPQYILKNLNST
ncbi:MAG: 2-oxoacid:acceptor oxidoreductase subunit alpha [Syntrophaceae bacterium]|nr:2-oxoacid:acceptor oxidoreductase subunit alpha [Syntrophaceae bacterium]